MNFIIFYSLILLKQRFNYRRKDSYWKYDLFITLVMLIIGYGLHILKNETDPGNFLELQRTINSSIIYITLLTNITSLIRSNKHIGLPFKSFLPLKKYQINCLHIVQLTFTNLYVFSLAFLLLLWYFGLISGINLILIQLIILFCNVCKLLVFYTKERVFNKVRTSLKTALIAKFPVFLSLAVNNKKIINVLRTNAVMGICLMSLLKFEHKHVFVQELQNIYKNSPLLYLMLLPTNYFGLITNNFWGQNPGIFVNFYLRGMNPYQQFIHFIKFNLVAIIFAIFNIYILGFLIPKSISQFIIEIIIYFSFSLIIGFYFSNSYPRKMHHTKKIKSTSMVPGLIGILILFYFITTSISMVFIAMTVLLIAICVILLISIKSYHAELNEEKIIETLFGKE
jgi:hypothetical protein